MQQYFVAVGWGGGGGGGGGGVFSAFAASEVFSRLFCLEARPEVDARNEPEVAVDRCFRLLSAEIMRDV